MSTEKTKPSDNNTPKIDTKLSKKKPATNPEKPSSPVSEPHIHIREFSLNEQSNIEHLLRKKLDKTLISYRPGPGGTKTAYLEGNVVIELANKILGFNGWSFQIKDLKLEHKEKSPQGEYHFVHSCIVRIILKDGTFREDVGFGDIKNKFLGAAIENSKKSAVTDGLKRALRLFGNSLGNCLYDKKHLTDLNSKTPITDESLEAMIKKTDVFPELINSRVPTNIHGTPDVRAIKTENPEEAFDDETGHLSTGKKRNISHVYSNGVTTTPDSASKRRPHTIVTVEPKVELKTPSMNLDDKIEKEALELSNKKESTTPDINTDSKQQPQDEGDSDFISDDSLDFEALDRKIAENNLRKERSEADAKSFAKVLDKLPDNISEDQLSFKNAAALIPASNKEKDDIVEELNKLTKVANFNILNNENRPASKDKPLLLNVDKSMKISSENFEKVGHYRDPKNRKYVASAHGSNAAKLKK